MNEERRTPFDKLRANGVGFLLNFDLVPLASIAGWVGLALFQLDHYQTGPLRAGGVNVTSRPPQPTMAAWAWVRNMKNSSAASPARKRGYCLAIGSPFPVREILDG